MDIRPDYANIEEDGKIVRVDPDDVEVGQTILVQPGERVPIDGVIVSGESSLNTSALTGESLPREVGRGDEIISGSINMSGVLQVRTTKEFGDSTVSKILELVEDSASRKSKSEDFIAKFARVYTPPYVMERWPLPSCRPCSLCFQWRFAWFRNVRDMDLPRPRIPRNQLPVCFGRQYSAVVLRRNRRRKP